MRILHDLLPPRFYRQILQGVKTADDEVDEGHGGNGATHDNGGLFGLGPVQQLVDVHLSVPVHSSQSDVDVTEGSVTIGAWDVTV